MSVQNLLTPRSSSAGALDVASVTSHNEITQTADQQHVAARQSNVVPSFVAKEDTIKAEILWALQVVKCHHSFKSNENIEKLFQAMFPDRSTAKHFSCGEKKTAYMCWVGLAPHFKSILDSYIKEKLFVLCFDENMNFVTKNKQLDVHIRVWEDNTVSTRFYGSAFLGHADANTLLEKVLETVNRLNLCYLVQVSMDGPSDNWKFFQLLQEKVNTDLNSRFLNIGSCGLHVVHGAFKTGFYTDSDSGVHEFFNAIFWLFKDTPAHREDFTKVTDSEVFPLKFCKHRWLENVVVAERSLQVLENVKKYVSSVRKGELKDPKTKSFKTVQTMINDPLLKTKIHVFLSIAKVFTPFLIVYQADRPMLPFLTDDMQLILKTLMKRFIKPSVFNDKNNAFKLVSMDVSKQASFCDQSKIDLGFSAESAMRKLVADNKVSERQALEVHIDFRESLIRVIKKLQEKSPIKYSLVRNISCLDPRLLASDGEVSITRMKRVLRSLVDNKKIREESCDEILNEFLDVTVSRSIGKYRAFDHKDEKQRVDV